MCITTQRWAARLRVGRRALAPASTRWRAGDVGLCRRVYGRSACLLTAAGTEVDKQLGVSGTLPSRNGSDALLISLESVFPDKAPSLQGVDALTDTDATNVLHILSQVHLRSIPTSAVLLGHYQSLALAIVDTLPQHCAFLSNADLAQAFLACSNMCHLPKGSKGGKLEAAGQRVATSARHQMTEVLIPHLIDRFSQSSFAAPLGSHVARLVRALSGLPLDIRQSSAYAAACELLHRAGRSAASKMTIREAASILTCSTVDPLLIPPCADHLIAYYSRLTSADASRLGQSLSHRTQLQLLWSFQVAKLNAPQQYQAAAKAVDLKSFGCRLADTLCAAFADPSNKWDVTLVHRAIEGAALLQMRDVRLVRGFCDKGVARRPPELSGRTALALLDIIYGAQRQRRQMYDPGPLVRSCIAKALAYAGARRERRWTAFECWQICRLLPKLDPRASNRDFTHMVKHTAWAEHTQRGQGSFGWEAVFTNCKMFVSRLHGLAKARVPRGVFYAFCSAASEVPGFFDNLEPRDTLTMLNILIRCTGLEDLVTAVLDAALRHARSGESMPYAVYAAVKLKRPEYMKPLWEALQPCVPKMGLRDLNNLLWAAASLNAKDIEFSAVLERLPVVLSDVQPPTSPATVVSTDGAGAGPSAVNQMWIAAEESGEFVRTDLPGWQIAQLAWSIATLKLSDTKHLQLLLMTAITEDTVLKPIDYTNIVWAAASLRMELKETVFWARMRTELASTLRGWRVKEICSCLWSLGLMRLSPGHHALETMVTKVATHIETIPVLHVINSVSGVALLNHMPSRSVLEFVEEEVVRNLMNSKAQDLSKTLHLFARLAYEPRRLLEALESGLPHTSRLLSRDVHTAVKVLTCIATFDMDHPRLYAWTMQQLSHMDDCDFTGALMHQVILAHMLAEASGCKAEHLPDFVQARQRQILASAISIERSWNRAVLNNLKAKLDELGYGPARLGATVGDGLVHIDLLLEGMVCGTKPVVLELLDANHVALNTGQPLGRWLIRRRLLDAFGFHVVTVSEDAWLANSAPHEMLMCLLQDCRRAPNAVREHARSNQISYVEAVYYTDVHDYSSRVTYISDR